MTFTLTRLPWAPNALAPHISAETIQYHYGKHHQAYVNKLNELVRGSRWDGKSLTSRPREEILWFFCLALVTDAEGTMFNQAAQVWNHTFYWHSLSPKGGGEPTGSLNDYIKRDFGSFQDFKAKFSAAAAGHFGSGWAWLCLENDKLKIVQTHDAQNPIRTGEGTPLLACDVWEHAYYIDYRNARPEYIEAWWKVINWEFGNSNLAKAKKTNESALWESLLPSD